MQILAHVTVSRWICHPPLHHTLFSSSFLNPFPLFSKDEDAVSELNALMETKTDEQVNRLLADIDENFLFQAIDIKHKKVEF